MRIAIMGLARSGMAAAKLALKLGYEVRISDGCLDHGHATKPSESMLKKAQELRELGAYVELGEHTKQFIEGASLLILSPGVPDSAAPLVWAREMGIEAVGETEFAARHCKGRFACITGTNGKTTTTSLVDAILNEAGVPHVTGGNIGIPLSELALETTDEHVVVLEMSSFQLETIRDLSPAVSVWLNLTPDHLDRYKNVAEYRLAKENIFLRQKPGTYAVVWHEERKNEEAILRRQGLKPVWVDETGLDESVASDSWARIEEGQFAVTLDGNRTTFGKPEDMLLRGRHNHINLLCAMAVAKALGIDQKATARACQKFASLSHRIEEVARLGSVAFVDDSKGTNPEATIEAVKAFPYPIALILGGYDKGTDYSLLIPHMKGQVKELVLLGATNDKFEAIYSKDFKCHKTSSMKEAVAKGLEIVKEGGTVLLSPACASFDMYKNYEVRGDDFAKEARLICTISTNQNK